MTQGTHTRALQQPRGVGWARGGREVQERGDIGMLKADSCWHKAETNTIV